MRIRQVLVPPRYSRFMTEARTRLRPKSAFHNDARIREMAATNLAEEGIEGLTLGKVARDLGMSHTAMTHRYEHLDDLLCDLWEHFAVPQIDRTLAWISDEVAHFGDSDTVSKVAINKALFRETTEKLVMLELLVLAPNRSKLREVVQRTFDGCLGESIRNEPVVATQVVFLFALVVGIQAELRTASANQLQLIAVLSEVINAMASPGEVIALPKVDASHMRRYDFNTGDVRIDRILTSCLENVGRRGLVDATMSSIARDAGVSLGLIYSVYNSKVDLFFEATAIQSELGYKANLDFVMSLNKKFGTGIANAILIREWLSPNLSQFRAALLEEVRITWHNLDLRRRIQKVRQNLVKDERVNGSRRTLSPFEQAVQMVTLGLPIGIYIMGEALPATANLPFSTVTIPVF